MRKLRIGIVGAGAIARTHADAFLQSGDLCEICAVCNRHTDKAEALVREKGLTARVYATLAEAAAEQALDAVSICLAPGQHCETAVWAMEHGIHVLTEKPMANSLEECDRMIAAGRAADVRLGVVCQLRFTSCAQRVRRLLQAEAFGPLEYATVDSLWWRGPQYHDVAWRGSWTGEGGGVMTAQALHHVDLLQYLIGMPAQVTAVMGNVGHPNTQCEDVASAVLQYPDKFVQLSASLVAHGERQALRFYCEKGCLSIPWDPAADKAMPNGYPQPDPEAVAQIRAAYEAIPALPAEGHAGQVRNFLLAVLGKEPLLADGSEGRKPIELITAVYESACFGRTVTLPLTPQSPLYTTAGKGRFLPHYHEKTHSVETVAAAPITLAAEQ
jgi:predicted dehydrogenase